MAGPATPGGRHDVMPARAAAECAQQSRQQARRDEWIIHGVNDEAGRSTGQPAEPGQKRRKLPLLPARILDEPHGQQARVVVRAPAAQDSARMAAQDDDGRGQAAGDAARFYGQFERRLLAKWRQRFREGQRPRRAGGQDDRDQALRGGFSRRHRNRQTIRQAGAECISGALLRRGERNRIAGRERIDTQAQESKDRIVCAPARVKGYP